MGSATASATMHLSATIRSSSYPSSCFEQVRSLAAALTNLHALARENTRAGLRLFLRVIVATRRLRPMFLAAQISANSSAYSVRPALWTHRPKAAKLRLRFEPV